MFRTYIIWLILRQEYETKTSTSLLDLVITNNKSKIAESGVVHVQISDHSLVYVILIKTVEKMKSRKLYFRSLRHIDRDMFLADLHTVLIPFGVMDTFDDVNDKLLCSRHFLRRCLMNTRHWRNFTCGAIKSLTWQKNGARRSATEIGSERYSQGTEQTITMNVTKPKETHYKAQSHKGIIFYKGAGGQPKGILEDIPAPLTL